MKVFKHEKTRCCGKCIPIINNLFYVATSNEISVLRASEMTENGCAVIQAVSRRAFTAVARVQFQASLCEIHEKNIIGNSVSPSTFVSPVIFYLPTLLFNPFIIDVI